MHVDEFLLLISGVFEERMSEELITVPTISGIF
jgi:hypothetical protein